MCLLLRYYTVVLPAMSRIFRMAQQKNCETRMRTLRAAYQELAARLAKTGFIWPGTIQRRLLTCGRVECACHSDPKRRHGPYAYWTSKKAQKTISQLLTPAEAELYEEWIENRRQLEQTVRAMKRLSRQAAKAELKLRRQRRHAAPPPEVS